MRRAKSVTRLCAGPGELFRTADCWELFCFGKQKSCFLTAQILAIWNEL